jgi:hypothetical protein
VNAHAGEKRRSADSVLKRGQGGPFQKPTRRTLGPQHAG